MGDLICTLAKHEEMAELAVQQPQQWREQGLARWYSLVLAIGTENESIKLGVLGHDRPWWEDRPEKERYFKRSCPLQPTADSRGKGRHSAEAATALMGVLDFLSDEEISEDELVTRVVSDYGCSNWAVRNAICVAVSAKLAVRRHEPGIILEVARLFAAPVTVGGHQACKIKLTPAGELWQQSQPRATAKDPWGEEAGQELLAEGRRIARSMVWPGQAPPAAGISGEDELPAFVRRARVLIEMKRLSRTDFCRACETRHRFCFASRHDDLNGGSLSDVDIRCSKAEDAKAQFVSTSAEF